MFKVVAVGDDNAVQAKQFHENLSLDDGVQVYGNYNDFFKDPHIGIFYIELPHIKGYKRKFSICLKK